MTTLKITGDHKEVWVYQGIDLGGRNNNQKRFSFKREDDTIWLYKHLLIPSYSQPGSKWEMTIRSWVKQDGSNVWGIIELGEEKPRFLGMLEENECVKIQIKSESTRVMLDMDKESKGKMKDSEIDRLLEPLKEEYARRDRKGKGAMLAVIYEKIGLY